MLATAERYQAKALSPRSSPDTDPPAAADPARDLPLIEAAARGERAEPAGQGLAAEHGLRVGQRVAGHVRLGEELGQGRGRAGVADAGTVVGEDHRRSDARDLDRTADADLVHLLDALAPQIGPDLPAVLHQSLALDHIQVRQGGDPLLQPLVALDGDVVGNGEAGLVLEHLLGVVEEIEWRDRVFRTAGRKRPVAGMGIISPVCCCQ